MTAITAVADRRTRDVGDDSRSRPERRGIRPVTRRRRRIALGLAIAGLAIAGNVWIYSTLGEKTPVLQVGQDVLAGQEMTSAMFRVVEVDVDPSVAVVPADQLAAIVGRYAKVRVTSGSLLTQEMVQLDPLVSDGAAIVAVRVPEGALPQGIRERVPVDLVLPPAQDPTTSVQQPVVVSGRVIGLPQTSESALGTLSLSVEVADDDAATLAAADDVRVVLRQPSADPARSGGGS